MILLDATTDSLRLITSASSTIEYHVSYAEFTASPTFILGESSGSISSATTTTVLAAPAASTVRQVKSVSIVNTSTSNVPNVVSAVFTVSGTDRYLWTARLFPGAKLTYNADDGWKMLDSTAGFPVVYNPNVAREAHIKEASAYEANTMTNYYQAVPALANAGEPRKTTFNGTDITASRAFDGTSHLDGRTYAPMSGSESWLQGFSACSCTRPFKAILFDFLSSGTAFTVTTTTSQAATTAAIPARDLSLSTNGVGVIPILYCAAASTNGAVSGITLSYTNQAGTASRTATQIATLNTSLAAGVFHMFSLQAGDTGVRSVQNITLGTSLVTGTYYIILVKPLAHTNALDTMGTYGYLGSMTNYGVKLLGTEFLVPAASHTSAGASTSHAESLEWSVRYV